jgi:hypothetical protein
MDRRKMLKGFGSMIGMAGGLQSPLLNPAPLAEASVRPEAALNGGSSEPSSVRRGTESSGAADIRKLSQHFKVPNDNTSPWIFMPGENIQSLSTANHPGYVTLRDAGKGMDIKGILDKAIAIDDFPLPWEFHLGLVGGVNCCGEGNWAHGLNLAVTFSDPSRWPEDRTEVPPETHSLQVFVVHLSAPQLGSTPLNYNEPGHEVYLVYGRGDLAPEAVGNWGVPYIWQGYPEVVWDRSEGPASFALSFRVKMDSPTLLEIGFFGGMQGHSHPGWRMKNVDVSRLGKITGIWEIGPIISLDRWIPDVLARELGISPSPPIEPAPSEDHQIDYAVFFGAGLKNLEHMSDDFDDPVPMAKWYHEAKEMIDYYSHPGYLTATFLGTTDDAWGMCSSAAGQMIDLTQRKPFPGYEMEICFIPPEDNIPWNLYMSSIIIIDENGRKVGSENAPPVAEVRPGYNWHPGVQNVPREGRHRFSNNTPSLDSEENKKNDPIFVEFENEVPQSILSHRPLYMLLQVIDASHMRIGFKANKTDFWYLCKTFDTTTTFGKIGKFWAHPCLTVSLAEGVEKGWGIGNYPRCPQVLIDYVHFRYGLSTER